MILLDTLPIANVTGSTMPTPLLVQQPTANLQTSARYSKSAANREAIILRNVLRWARDKGYLGRLPKVEYPDHLQEPEKVRGGIFTETDWRRYIALLVHDIKRRARCIDKLRYHIMIVRRLERLTLLVPTFNIVSGIRPQEAKQLTQKQIFSRVDPTTGHTFTCVSTLPKSNLKILVRPDG